MADARIITTAPTLEKIGARMTEAVDQGPSGLEGMSDIDKAQFLAQLPRAIDAIKRAETSSRIMSTPSHQFASLLQSTIAENATATEPLTAGALEAKFDTNDWFGWAKTLWHMIKDAKNKFPWQNPPAAAQRVAQFGSSSRIALFGDWATGLYGAPKITGHIEQSNGIDIVMHLGDVYYSGTEGEFKDRFSKFWPKRPDSLHIGLNGNHEMYSGGRPYWNVIQQAPFSQTSTCCAYENNDWVIVGLDTAYQDFDLYQDPAKGHDEVAWLHSIVDTAIARDQRVVLFSHHQPFSLLDHQGPNLRAKMEATLLNTKKIFAWYWGHEHNCVIYDRHEGWQMYGRCVGHAGMPEFRKLKLPPVTTPQFRRIEGSANAPSARVLDGPNRFIQHEETSFMPHGYVQLRFEGKQLFETYLDPEGNTLIPETELKK